MPKARLTVKWTLVVSMVTTISILVLGVSSLGTEWLLKQRFAVNPKTKAGRGCACISPNLKEAFQKSAVVFSGEVLSVREERLYFGSEYSDTKTTRLHVLRNWKGQLGKTVEVHGPPLGCGVFFEKGKQYLVFGSLNSPHGYYTDYCAGTRTLVKSLTDFEDLQT